MAWLAAETDDTVWPMTADMVLQMVDKGLLDGERVELLDGRLLAVAPQGPEHRYVGHRIRHVLEDAYGRDRVDGQAPLVGDEHALPEPDAFVTRTPLADFRQRHPRGSDCLLVVEVAQTSQRRDRAKADIYARIGVPEYWLVDLVAQRVERYSRPIDDARYASTQVLTSDETLTLPDTDITHTVASLFGN